MKKGSKIGTIVLLVLVAALAALGITGVIWKNEDLNAQPSAYEVYQEEAAKTRGEALTAMAIADQAIENIKGYIGQIEADVEAYTAAGGDAAAVSTYLETAQKALTDAEAARKKMDETNEKIETQASFTEADVDGYSKVMEKDPSILSMRVSQMITTLKTITKIDENESASNPSFETIARKQANLLRAAMMGEYPDLELPEAFTVEQASSDVRAAKVEVPATFRSTLIENHEYVFWIAGVLLVAALLCFLGWKNPPMLKKVGATANKNMMLVALVVITLLFFVLTQYKNLTPDNIYNVINQYSYIIILATGMLLCIVSSANIDLSVGRVMGFIAACAAKFIIEARMSVPLSMLICLLIGIAIGAWQGFWIAYVRIPAFVVTLAGQLTFYGLTMVLLKGETVAPFPESFNNIFTMALPDFLGQAFGIDAGINITTLLIGAIIILAFIFIQLRNRASRQKKNYEVESIGTFIIKLVVVSGVVGYLFYSLAVKAGMPTILITVSLVVLIYTFITSKMVIGRHLYAMGGNVNAARLSGVKTQRMLFLVYVNMGFLAALAGLALASRMNSASPMSGQGEELNAIAACYIGGASAYGGVGTVGGALIGALTMGMIKNGMSMMSMKQDLQQVVLGLVLLVAVVVDILSKSSGSNVFSSFFAKLFGRKEKEPEAPQALADKAKS